MDLVKRLLVEEEGAEITEVALVVVLVAGAFLAGTPGLRDALVGAIGRITGAVNTNNTDSGLAAPA